MRLRYTGKVPVTFMTPAGEVHPDEEFTVPDHDAHAYMNRPDIEEVPDIPDAAPIKGKTVKAPNDATPSVGSEPQGVN